MLSYINLKMGKKISTSLAVPRKLQPMHKGGRGNCTLICVSWLRDHTHCQTLELMSAVNPPYFFIASVLSNSLFLALLIILMAQRLQLASPLGCCCTVTLHLPYDHHAQQNENVIACVRTVTFSVYARAVRIIGDRWKVLRKGKLVSIPAFLQLFFSKDRNF